MPARVSTSPPRASSVEYSSFLDSVLDHVCCSSTANRRGNNYNHNYQDRDRSRDDCHNDDCTNVPNNALLCGAGRDNDGCIPRQMRRGSRESSTSFFGKNIHSGAKNVHHDHPDRDCNSQLPEIILQHLKFQPLPIDAASYDFHCSTTSNGNAGEKSPSAAEAETAHMTVSSLDEFYNLFLANDAPHSFFKFHEKNGDEDIEITPWKKVAVVCDTQSNAKYCNNKSNATMKEMERTITFQTRMTSSFSGHSFTFGSSNKSNSSKKDIANSSSTTTPSSMTLGVIVVQRLIRHFARNPTGNNNDNSAHNHAQGRKYLKWILESHISFDYSDGNRGNDDDGNYGNNHPCSIFNNLGGKLSMGLGSFLVSNEVKCSTVCVRVILTEGDGITGVTPPSSPQSMRNDCRSGSNSDVLHNQEGTEGSAEDTASPQSAHGYLSFFFHPLLLPPDSLCGGGGKWNQGKEGYSPAPVTPTKKSPSKSASMSTNPLLDLENGCMGGGCTSPSELGASLLSAIKAKNDPRDDINLTNDADENDDFSGTAAELTVPETPPPTPPPSQSLLDPSSFMDLVTNTQKQIMNIANESDNDVAQSSTCQRKSAETLLLRNKQLTQQDDDILSSNTSRGSLKLKHISSFEYAREPSVSSASEGHMAMRRMILEKDSETKMFSSGKTQRGKSSSRDAPSLDVTGTEPFAVLPSSSFSSFPNSIVNTPVSLQGLSMRIEMQVRSPTTGPVSNTSSSSTSTTYSSYCSPSNNNSNSSDSQSFGTSALTIPFHRSKGSFSSPLDEKILRNIRKRVSRTWISWAESWCMRIWEEEEAERSRRKSMGLAAGSSSLIPRRSSRNVRPVVRRLSSGRRKRDVLGGCVQGSGRCSTGGGTVRNESPLALSSFVSRSLSNLSMNSTASFSRPLGDRWQPFDIRSILSDSSKISFFGDRIEKWMFVVGKNGVGGGDIGIEVTCMFTMKQNLLLRVSSPPTVSMSFVRPDVDACLQPKRESKTSEPIQTQVPEKNSDVAAIDAKTGRNSRRNGWKKALSMRKTIETKIIKKPVL